jgi:hypothetical protein
VSATQPPDSLGADGLDTIGRREGTVLCPALHVTKDLPSFIIEDPMMDGCLRASVIAAWQVFARVILPLEDMPPFNASIIKLA